MDLETHSVAIQKIGSHSVTVTMKGKIDGDTHIVNLNIAFLFII